MGAAPVERKLRTLGPAREEPGRPRLPTAEDRRRRAREWLRFECLGSGVVEEVSGNRLRFWHLTFQEHLAALQLAWLDDGEEGPIRVLYTWQSPAPAPRLRQNPFFNHERHEKTRKGAVHGSSSCCSARTLFFVSFRVFRRALFAREVLSADSPVNGSPGTDLSGAAAGAA